MGWGLEKKLRNTALSGCFLDKPSAEYDACIFDVCSEARRVSSGPRPQSAKQLCLSICRPAFKKCPNGMVVLMFDDASRMHEARASLHAKRYKPLTPEKAEKAVQAGKIVICGQAYVPSMVPYTAGEVSGLLLTSPVVWPRLWASGHGKKKAWELLYDAFIWCHHQFAAKTQTCIMWYLGDPFVWPYCRRDELAAISSAVCSNTFGEADQRVCEAAKELARAGYNRIWMQTIDTDFLLQTLCTYTWHTLNEFHLSLKNEKVDLLKMCSTYGGPSPSQRMTCAFWLMAAGGVDYCRGLVRFGFATKDLLSMAISSKQPVITHDESQITLRPLAVISRLCGLSKRNIKSSVHEFADELSSMSFCIALFAGFGKHVSPCGGPPLPEKRCIALTEDQGLTSVLLRRLRDGDIDMFDIPIYC